MFSGHQVGFHDGFGGGCLGWSTGCGGGGGGGSHLPLVYLVGTVVRWWCWYTMLVVVGFLLGIVLPCWHCGGVLVLVHNGGGDLPCLCGGNCGVV